MNIMLLLMLVNVVLKICCVGLGFGYDDWDYREVMVLLEGYIQCGLIVIFFSAAVVDVVGIIGLNVQGDIFLDMGFQFGLQVQ